MNTTIEVKPIDIGKASEATKKSVILLSHATDLIIQNQIAYDHSATFRIEIKRELKNIEELRKFMKEPVLTAGRRIDDLFRPSLDNLKKADELTERERIRFFNEQEQIRREQERKLQQEADRKRQEALKKAEIARENGQDIKAEKYEEKANNTIAPTLAPRVEKTKGTVIKKLWRARIIDEASVPRDFLIIDMKKLNDFARATRGTMPIAGVQFYYDEIESTPILLIKT